MNTPVSTRAARPPLRQFLPALLLMPTVALLLSAVMTWANLPLGEAFLPRWGRSFVACLIVLPLVLVFLAVVEKPVEAAFSSMSKFGRTLLVSLLTACVIEAVLALALTLLGSGAGAGFAQHWWMAFSRSLPVGVVIGLFMGFYMKPRMDRMRGAVAR